MPDETSRPGRRNDGASSFFAGLHRRGDWPISEPFEPPERFGRKGDIPMKALITLGAGAVASTILCASADAQTARPGSHGLASATLVEPIQYGPQRCRIIQRWDDGEFVTIRRCSTPYDGRAYRYSDWGRPRFYGDWDRPRYRHRFEDEGD
jgi:hypothetical protein